MRNQVHSRRSFAKSAALGAAMLSVAPKVTGAQSTPVASPAADAFPVTIDHVYGSTTIETQPVRIVTIGWSSADALVALGVIPVQVPLDSYAGDENGLLPWLTAAIGDNPLPETRDDSAGVPFEDVINAEPDLILARYSGISQEEYDTLSAIAPTVAFAETAWNANWQDVTRTAGRAMGLAEEAENLIAETEANVAARAAEYPSIQGKSYLYGTITDVFAIYVENDPRPQFLNSLGMVPSPVMAEIAGGDGTSFYVNVSFEKANTLVADIVLFWFSTQEGYDLHAEEFYMQALPGFNEGRFVPIIGTDLVMATSAWSTLSIDYALDTFLPLLDAAAQNVE